MSEDLSLAIYPTNHPSVYSSTHPSYHLSILFPQSSIHLTIHPSIQCVYVLPNHSIYLTSIHLSINYLIRHWLRQLWRLGYPKLCSWQAGDPGSQWNSSHLRLRTGDPRHSSKTVRQSKQVRPTQTLALVRPSIDWMRPPTFARAICFYCILQFKC